MRRERFDNDNWIVYVLKAAFFNLSFAEPGRYAKFLVGSPQNAISITILGIMFCRRINKVPEIPQLEKGWKTQTQAVSFADIFDSKGVFVQVFFDTFNGNNIFQDLARIWHAGKNRKPKKRRLTVLGQIW